MYCYFCKKNLWKNWIAENLSSFLFMKVFITLKVALYIFIIKKIENSYKINIYFNYFNNFFLKIIN